MIVGVQEKQEGGRRTAETEAGPSEEPDLPFEAWSLLQLREGVRRRGGKLTGGGVPKGNPPPPPPFPASFYNNM